MRPPGINELKIAAETMGIRMVCPSPIHAREAPRPDAGFDCQPDGNHFIRPVLEALQVEAYALHDDVTSLKR